MSELDKRLVGWEKWEGFDAFEDHCGPMFFRKIEGQDCSRLLLTEKHMNGQDNLHGGMLMTFADYVLFVLARDRLDGQRAVTVSFSCDFIATAGEGDMLEGSGEVIRETGRMMFLRGLVTCGDSTLLNFSGVLRKIKPR
jgi:acyl-coenzyme A thioesterase PaaI-like protein